MSGNSKKVIAFNYFGGKFTIVDEIVALFPLHVHFVDLFCGSMAVTLNKKPSSIETVNDINSDIINFFKVLRESPDELIRQLFFTPVSREEFNQSWEMEGCTEIEKARRFYVRVRQSFFSLGAQRKNKGWHIAKTQSRASIGETISKWNNGIEKLWPVIDRLKQIQIENKDFREVITALDFPDCFFYCDPPYPLEVRASKNDYKHEFSTQDHLDLSELLHKIKGKAMISGYDGPLMRELYGDWYMHAFEVRFNNIRSTKVQECIWTNYDFTKLNGKLTLNLK